MLFGLIKAAHYVGLAALLGGPAFWFLVWRPSSTKKPDTGPGDLAPTESVFVATTRAVMVLGFLLFAFSGVLDIMRAASDLFGFLVWEDFIYFATRSPMGQTILARVAIAGLFLVAGLGLGKRRRLPWLAPLIAGLSVVVLVSALSHQAGKESAIPLFADIIHLTATSVWGGGLIYFSLLPWRLIRAEANGVRRLAKMANAFSTVGLLSVATLMGTGIYIAVQQFFSAAAVTGTPYGAYFLRKLGGFAGILSVAVIHHFYFVPGLQRATHGETPPSGKPNAHRLAGRFLTLVRLEVVLLLGVLLATGFLTTQMPPVSPVGIVAATQISGEAGDGSYQLSLFPREGGQVLFELMVQDGDGRPLFLDGAELDLTMTDHYMPPYVLPMEGDELGVYRATALLSMGGRWLVTAMWTHGVEQHEAVIEFDTLTSLRDAQQERRYSWNAIWEKRLGILLFLIYGGLVVWGVYALVRGAQMPRSFILLTFGLLLVLGGGMQMFRVAEVPGPYSYRVNPVKRTPAVMARGTELYQANCMMCHGIDGRGDGPVASTLNPKPADFTAPNGIPQHSDGELFWWISQGIAGSSMPAFEALLTEEERWILVHYIRSFSQPKLR